MAIENHKGPTFSDYMDALHPGAPLIIDEFTGFMAGRISPASVSLRSEIESSFAEFSDNARTAQLEALRILNGGELPGIESIPLPDFIRLVPEENQPEQ